MTAPPLIFTIPYTEIEILSIQLPSKRFGGILYNPRQITTPELWLSVCLHCIEGKHWKLTIRRAVQTLCSTIYRKPNKYWFYLCPNFKAHGTLTSKGWNLKVIRIDKALSMKVIENQNGPPTFDGPTQMFRSVPLKKALKLILSSRRASKTEMKSCMQGLREIQLIGTQTPCWNLVSQ
jgi:hypothetical protein